MGRAERESGGEGGAGTQRNFIVHAQEQWVSGCLYSKRKRHEGKTLAWFAFVLDHCCKSRNEAISQVGKLTLISSVGPTVRKSAPGWVDWLGGILGLSWQGPRI